MCNKLIHKLKLKLGKKTKISAHIIVGVQHTTAEALNNCYGAASLVPNIHKEDNKCKK